MARVDQLVGGAGSPAAPDGLPERWSRTKPGGLRRLDGLRRMGDLLRLGGSGRSGGELSTRTRSDLLAALDGCARGSADTGAEPVRTIQFLRPPAVRDHLGCVACAAADAESRRWFFFFETETNHDPDVRDRIRAAHGLCPAHTRRLLDSTPAAAWLARGMFADLLRDAAAGTVRAGRATGVGPRLRGQWTARHPGGRLAGHPAPPACPVCSAVADRVADTLTVLGVALGGRNSGRSTAATAAYLAGPGLCVPHARRFFGVADAAAAVVVSEHLAAALTVPPEDAVATLLGGDDDAPARARIRQTQAAAVLAAAGAARHESFAARVEHLTAQPCCPLCAARDRATWRLLDWLAGRGGTSTREEPDAQAMREQLTAVCTTHLGDLVRSDGGGAWLSAPVATVVRLAAARAREAAEVVAAAARRGTAGGSLHDLAVRSGPRMSCPVCTWSAEAAARELRLVRLIGSDPRWAGAVVGAHGLCARCLPLVQPGDPASPWVQTFGSRARQLTFEVDEAVRTDSWSSRWDDRGTEMSAWQRAPYLLDGAVLGPRPPGDVR